MVTKNRSEFGCTPVPVARGPGAGQAAPAQATVSAPTACKEEGGGETRSAMPESDREATAHIVAHVLGRPSTVDMRVPLSTPIHEMLSALFTRIEFTLQRVVFCHRALPLPSTITCVSLAADLERPLRDYGFGRGAGSDHIHVVLELGCDPLQRPTHFRYDATEWMKEIP